MIKVKSLYRRGLYLVDAAANGGRRWLPSRGEVSLEEPSLGELAQHKANRLVSYEEPEVEEQSSASAPPPPAKQEPEVAPEPEPEQEETEEEDAPEELVVPVGAVEAHVSAGDDGVFGTEDDKVEIKKAGSSKAGELSPSSSKLQLQSLTKANLVEMAEANGIEVTSRMTKSAIISKIKESA
tara:strand:- start:14090 stop:14635 length:546 start_codon:yes stop_codon:yes gene_type:complete